MAPANQASFKVSAIDARMTPSGSGSVAPAAKIAKQRTRTSGKVPSGNRETPIDWASLTVAQAEKIKRKRRRVRFTTGANGKIHVDFNPSTGDPIGPNGLKLSLSLGTLVSVHAPLNVGKWDDLTVEQVRSLIDHALSKFDVDISKLYIQDWIIYRMKFRFELIQEEARKEVQNPEMMEIISKLGSSKF